MTCHSPEDKFQVVLQKARSYLPLENLELLKKVYEFSKAAHQQQLRADGNPYIIHPLAVTEILADLHLDFPTLAAGLLHDVLEDTTITGEILREKFGEEVSHIVEGVTKIDSLGSFTPELASHPGQSTFELTQQAENWRKMLIATAQDIRVVLLKLADRKHNMETLGSLDPEKIRRIASETLTLYAPLAQRLGMYQLKSDLEDLSLKYLESEVYGSLEKKIAQGETQKEAVIKACVEKVRSILSNSNFPYKISSRSKNLYSVYRKMVRQNKPFEEIQDLKGIRIITDTIEHCYSILGMIQTSFTPLPDTFTDYISMPKKNLYQSLHITITLPSSGGPKASETPQGEVIEVQIRTEEMHHVAEYGIAAHWKYKQRKKETGPTSTQRQSSPVQKDHFDNKLDWLKQLLEWQQETENPHEFLEGLKVELEFEEVFVFTPKGEVKKLPIGSTPIDFAYEIHTELGHQCVGAKVNGKMVRLDTHLKSGDRCEIIIRKGQHPHKDWIAFVKTPRARAKIRKFFRESGL